MKLMERVAKIDGQEDDELAQEMTKDRLMSFTGASLRNRAQSFNVGMINPYFKQGTGSSNKTESQEYSSNEVKFRTQSGIDMISNNLMSLMKKREEDKYYDLMSRKGQFREEIPSSLKSYVPDSGNALQSTIK